MNTKTKPVLFHNLHGTSILFSPLIKLIFISEWFCWNEDESGKLESGTHDSDGCELENILNADFVKEIIQEVVLL